MNLEELIQYAKNYQAEEKGLPIFFDPDKYSRTPIYRSEKLEIVVICFAAGQTSSVHDHQGSNCVIRVVRGKMLEQLFRDNGDQLEFVSNHYLEPGDVSGLDGIAIHQISNMDKSGSVLINFYSPPFQV
jgi:cysteine dioxygenase